MDITKFNFLNRHWDEFVKQENTSGYPDKDSERERIIKIGNAIERILTSEFQAEDCLNFLNWFFDRVWKELLYEKRFEDFKLNWKEKIGKSLDPGELIKDQVASIENDTRILRMLKGYHVTEDMEKYEKKGYKLAIQGENPRIGELLSIHKQINQIDITIDQYCTDFKIEEQTLYYLLIKRTHYICYGYLRAKEIYYLKNLLRELETGQYNSSTIQQNAEIAQEKKEKDKLSHKQQIILLEKLGLFESKIVDGLTLENKGKLFSYLLNRNEKNTTEYIRNLNIPKLKVSKDSYFVKSQGNLDEVNKLLKELGLINL